MLDLWTLVVVTVFVTTLLGGLLLFSWRQNRRMAALSWWGAGFLLGALASCLLVMRGRAPDLVSVALANAALFASYGLLWTGCRSFAGKGPRWSAVAAGPILWLCLCAVPDFFASFGARVLGASLTTAAYSFACAVEMSHTRPERLASRGPICIILILHAAVIASRPVILLAFGASGEGTLFTFPWITAHAFGTLVVTVLLSFLFLAITKERVEGEQRIMASCDPLTGLLNRRAFRERAEAWLADTAEGAGSVLLLLDIDHFKRINDQHGHATGDAVLENFARVATEALPPDALVARLGGEEFGCLLPGATRIEGYYAAEYLRNALALRPLPLGEDSVAVTVSIGLATTLECGRDLGALMSRADIALYEAKRAGRNTVVVGESGLSQVA